MSKLRWLAIFAMLACGKGTLAQGGMRATVSTHSVTLAWDASTTAGVNYHVSRNGTLIASPTTTSYVDSGLPASTTFNYQVTAFYVTCPTLPTPCTDSTPGSVSATTPADATIVVISIAPASASIQTGKTQQFLANVTGTTNTSVTWSATGGTISAAGLYTAPGTAGNFTVTATSSADPSKSANASVAVVAPPTSGFNPGDRIKTLSTANIRATAPVSGYGTLLGTEPTGAIGTITGATQVVTTLGWTWIQVKFDSCSSSIPNCTGYMGSDNMVIVAPAPPPTPTLKISCTASVNSNTCIISSTAIPAGTPYTVTASEGGLTATTTGTSK